jgi:hypothetical protein
MHLTGLHLLVTYQCTFECDHCFVWGSPRQEGTLTLQDIRSILDQAQELGTIQSIYFEGGEPFLFYPILVQAVNEAARRGFDVGIVTNAYWATSVEDALAWLKPFQGLLMDLSVSSDLFHSTEKLSRQAQVASAAAAQLNLPSGLISVARPGDSACPPASGQLPIGDSQVMFRGRAAQTLAPAAAHFPPEAFTSCPHEDLREPGRVHVDPLGFLHVCQGIVLGGLFQHSLKEICARYTPEAHPVIGPLLAGGPLALAQQYHVDLRPTYADACHLCYETRLALRARFPDLLTPAQMYGG